MDLSTTLSSINSLSIDDRIRLVEAVWDGIAAERPIPELTSAQIEELDRRLEAHRAQPDDVISWDEVKSDALARGRRK